MATIHISTITSANFSRQRKEMKIYYGTHATPFGTSLIALSEKAICYLGFQKNSSNIELLRSAWPSAKLFYKPKMTRDLVKRIFYSNSSSLSFSLLLKGTSFQIKVLKALLSYTSCGELLSYQSLASKIGDEKMARAVGNALKMNQIAYLIPCHRIIRKNGEIGQYRWGKECKQSLIQYEKQLTKN